MMRDCITGQPYTIWLISDDRKIAVSTDVIPYPLKTTASDGAEISIKRLEVCGKKIECKGRRFKDKESLKITSDVGERSSETTVQCTSGKFCIEINPAASSNWHGPITLLIHRENGEVLSISYPVGIECLYSKHMYAESSKLHREDFDKFNEEIQFYYDRNKLKIS